MQDNHPENPALSLADIPWEDVLFRSLFPMLPWQSLFHLRAANKELQACVNEYFVVCRRVNLIQTGPKMNSATFKTITEHNQSIRLLFLRNFKDWLNDAVMCPVISRNVYLSKLDITNCTCLTDLSVRTLASSCPDLCELRMRDCTWLGSQAVISIAEGCPKLSHLDVTGCWGVNDESVKVLSVKCRELQFLSVARVYGITDSSVELVARNCPSLVHLNVQGCWRLTNQSITMIGEYCKNLTMLQVRDCRDVNEMSLARLRMKGIGVDVPRKKWQLGDDMSRYLGRINLNLQI